MGLGLFMVLFIVGGFEILIEARNIKKVRKMNVKLRILENVFPGLKRDEVIALLNQQDKDTGMDGILKLCAMILWDDMDRIYTALTELIQDSGSMCIWSYRMNDDSDKSKFNIARVLLRWLQAEYDKDVYAMFQNPMDGKKIVLSVIAYGIVAILLYDLMAITHHVPGVAAALAIFQH